jgi:hypothetical protein
MLSAEMIRTALELPVEDQLELTRRLLENAVLPSPLSEAFKEGIRRIEDAASGQTAGFTEAQFRDALQRSSFFTRIFRRTFENSPRIIAPSRG